MFSNKNQSCHRFLVHVAQTDVRNSLGFTRLQIDPGLRFRLNFAPLWEGPDPPPTRPTLAMSHPELGSLGGEIIATIMDIADKRKQRSHNSIVGMLLELFDKVLHFIKNVLSTCGLYDNVVY